MATNKTSTIIFKGEDQISPAIKGATASVAGLSKSFEGVENASEKTAVQIKSELTKAIASVSNELAKLSTQKLTPEVRLKQDQLLSQLSGLKTQLREVDKLVVQPKVQIDPLQLNAISQSFSAISSKLTELKGAASAAFGEISAAERKLSTVSGESKQLIKNFGDLASANKFQTTTAQLANASYEVLSAGFTKTADVTKILDASTKGAVGGFSDVTTVSKATISALNAYGQGADQAASFVDKFVSVQQSGLITVDQYASQLSRIAPTAAAAGVSLDELNGAIATATASGVPVESTFAGLRTALGAILKPSAEAVELSKELGISFNATGLRTLGLSGILKQLKTTGNDSADTLLKLFGSTEALAAIAPSINSIEKLEANIKASADSAGLSAENFSKAIDPIKAFQNETTEALAILGRDIAKVFNPVINASKAVVAAFRGLPAPLQEIIAFVVGGGAAIATTGAAISGFLAVLQPTLAGLGFLVTGATTALTALTLSEVGLGTATATTTATIGSQSVAAGALGTSTGVASVGVNGLSASLAGLGKASVAAFAFVNTAIAGVSISLSSIGGLLAGAGALIGTLAIKAAFAISSIVVALAPLAIKLGLILLAFDAIKNTTNLFGSIDSNEAQQAVDKILFKTDQVAKKLEEGSKKAESFTDKLGGGFDKAESPIQQAALAITNLTNALIGAESGASKFGSSFGLITQQQLEAQRVSIAYDNAITVLSGSWRAGVNIVQKYGTAIDFEKNATKLSTKEKEDYKKQLDKTNENLKEEINQLKELAKQKGFKDTGINGEIKVRETILKQGEAKLAILDAEKQKIESTTKALADSEKQRVKDVKAAQKEIAEGAKKRALEEETRQRAKAFDTKATSESKAFETQSRTEKQAFEKSLNDDKKKFEAGQKTDKDKFEKDLQNQQRTFNEAEKAKDQSYQRSKQDLERAFTAQQQVAKEAFDKQQQAASKAFDDRQNEEKKTADTQFAQRRLEIERKLQLDAAKSPEDRAKLEAEFKITDEKSAKEKEAFAQLKAEEEAFVKKQQADKQAFDDAQKVANQAFEKQQQAEKIAFDDVLKLKDQEYEKQKEKAKIDFEDTLKAKREVLESGENKKKEDFDTAQTLKKQDFEDIERKKKEDFDTAQNLKKQDFEDIERKKKQAFEDNLKLLEAQFKADERAKDLANAQQVAAVKSTSPTVQSPSFTSSLINAAKGGTNELAPSILLPTANISPRAKGGRFDSGQQLLVGEQGAELVTFGSSGYVSNATDSKQILQANNSAPSSVSTARMEALLGQLVGKLDRPNVSVQTSENPSDVVVKVQREIARAAALNSGI